MIQECEKHQVALAICRKKVRIQIWCNMFVLYLIGGMGSVRQPDYLECGWQYYSSLKKVKKKMKKISLRRSHIDRWKKDELDFSSLKNLTANYTD